MNKWQVNGEVIEEYTGLPVRTGMQYDHHGLHKTSPLVQAAMVAGTDLALICAIQIAASGGREVFVNRSIRVAANGRVASDSWVASGKPGDAAKNVRGWTIDAVCAFAGIAVKQINAVDYPQKLVGESLLPSIEIPPARMTVNHLAAR